MAYCFKCKIKRELLDPKDMVAKNGRKMLTGDCPVCGSRLFVIKKNEPDREPVSEGVSGGDDEGLRPDMEGIQRPAGN